VPFRTTLTPAAREELRRRAKERFGSLRAANRVIEEAMGYAVAREHVRVPTTIYVDRGDETDIETSVVIDFEIDSAGAAVDWFVASAVAGGQESSPVHLSSTEADKACEQAHEKYCANKSDYR
jgi:hypothetical protein